MILNGISCFIELGFVFCGSNSGHIKVFSDAAIELGNELVCLFFFSFSLPLLGFGFWPQNELGVMK
jgi:hypothetical protein